MADDDGLEPNLDPNIGFPVPASEVGDYFPLDRDSDDPKRNHHDTTPDRTFEIGLVLGGTVSAGCYTAGVLDFLIEALDQWTKAKQEGNPAAPTHHVKIKIVTGTSGGGINAILLARMLGFAANPYDPKAPVPTNLLRTVWVDRITIDGLLRSDDLDNGKAVSSLLCGKILDDIGKEAIRFAGPPLGTHGTPTVRDYVDNCLPLVLTVTNMRGVPYAASFTGATDRPETFVLRADHVRFLANVSGSRLGAPPSYLRPDEIWVDYGPSSDAVCEDWMAAMNAARATSAFPLGLPPIVLQRNVEHYRYRYAVVGRPDGTRAAFWMKPRWPFLIAEGAKKTDPYKALCVDGGVFNNEPVSYAHDCLAGLLGTNARDGSAAKRAILLVDPFSSDGGIGPDADRGIFHSAEGLLGTLVSGARYQTADLGLFADKDVYSRFLVTPVGKVRVKDQKTGQLSDVVMSGGAALATNEIGAFIGFLCRDFREHDFLLGRRNCQQFLKEHFSLKPDNPLFRRSDGTLDAVQYTADGEIRIIPVMGSANVVVDEPVWPRDRFDPASVLPATERRLRRVADALANTSSFFWRELFKGAIRLVVDWKRNWLRDQLRKALDKGNL